MRSRIRRIVEALRPYHPERVYLYGSWARNEADSLSDVDLVVIKRTIRPFFDRLLEVSALIPAEAGAVDCLVYTPEEFQSMQHNGNAFAELIAEEAILIYDRQPES